MKNRETGHSQEVSSAMAGISVRSGRRIEKGERKEKAVRHWRTRKDPFAEVWEAELVPLLEKDADLTGLTLWEYLDEQYPGDYPYHLLRTLQRRVKHWRATEGPDQVVIFRQSVPPGHQGLSDFSRPRTAITIAGEPYPHLLYQYRLASSGWRYVQSVEGGESYTALAEGLQNALKRCGGAPREHRTDSLSAAYTTTAEQQQLTRLYSELCNHYGMKPTTNNRGVSHENGAIETAHGSFKHRLEQALKLRGSTDFDSVSAYQHFIDKIVNRLNRRCVRAYRAEQQVLQALPARRFTDYNERSVRVTTSSTISVKRGLYTVPSRLIGERLRVHLYHDRLECYVGQTHTLTLRRVYPDQPTGRARLINYHHIIHSLAAKPQAFRFSRFRDDILPNRQYRQLWQLAEQQFCPQMACKWMVTVLRIAHDHDCEPQLAASLLQQAEHGALPDLKSLQADYLQSGTPPDIPLRQHAIADYDQLLHNHWTNQGGEPCLSHWISC